MRIQGFTESEVPWQEAGISAHQIGAMLGNSVSVPVIGAVLANAMLAGGLTLKCHKFLAFYDPGNDDVGPWPKLLRLQPRLLRPSQPRLLRPSLLP